MNDGGALNRIHKHIIWIKFIDYFSLRVRILLRLVYILNHSLGNHRIFLLHLWLIHLDHRAAPLFKDLLEVEHRSQVFDRL